MIPVSDDAIIKCIEEFQEHEGYSPTIREIGEELGIRGSATMQDRVTRLIEQGRLRKTPGRARSIVVIH